MNRYKFLESLSFSKEKKLYFLELHKFCLTINQDLMLKYKLFSEKFNYFYAAGGAIRDALLLDIDQVKDIDFICSLDNSDNLSQQNIKYDFLNNETLKSYFLNHTQANFLFQTNKTEISHTELEILKDILNEVYNNSSDFYIHILNKFIISQYLENKFICNSQYNSRKEGLNTDEVLNNYGNNINALIGLLKSNITLNNKSYDIDFLLPKINNYVQENFDLHICQAAFPYNPIHIYRPNPNNEKSIEYFESDLYKQNTLFLFEQELKYIKFVEDNINDNDLFLTYLNKYLLITEGFIFNATKKVISFNDISEHEIKNSLKKHLLTILKKYPYPLYLHNEITNDKSILNILEHEKSEISLW